MSVFASATGSISLTDTVAGSTTFSKILNSGFVGDLSSFAQNYLVGTSPTTFAVPNALAQFFYVKNLSTVTGTTITVSWTPHGLSLPTTILTLDPGAVMIFSENGVNGITTLSITASAVNTPIEFLMVG